MIKKLMCSLLVTGALYAAQPVTGRKGNAQGTKGDATQSNLPIATIRSSGGLVSMESQHPPV